MEEINALKIRNNLGEVLDRLNVTKEPIFITKGRKIRAVLVTPDQFEKRFLDWKVKEEKKQIFESIKSLRGRTKEKKGSLEILRSLRGYE
jgi:PHD/YefM family antitoxin component YafN of YafNO toxin-antitoxin module